MKNNYSPFYGLKSFQSVTILLLVGISLAIGASTCSEELPQNSQLRIESGNFDPNKPTIVFFGGGNCYRSWVDTESWENENTFGDAWFEQANVISFYYYHPDESTSDTTYFNCAKIVVDTLAKLAPNYSRDVQACGFSTGGSPALDLGIYVNTKRNDLKYRIKQVTLMDAPCYAYEDRISIFNSSGSLNDPRLIINLLGALRNESQPYANTLNVAVMNAHDEVFWWYVNSFKMENGNTYNNGVSGGVYWSILGEGKNLNLASTNDRPEYFFDWTGDERQGAFKLFDETIQGKLPAPAILKAPVYRGGYEVLLSCELSPNTAFYQLLVGDDPDHLIPLGPRSTVPFTEYISIPEGKKFWTIASIDHLGSSVFPQARLIQVN